MYGEILHSLQAVISEIVVRKIILEKVLMEY